MAAMRGRLLLVMAVVAVGLTSSASAATYAVTSCANPSGAVAPAGDGSGGWKPVGFGPGRLVQDQCADTPSRLVASIDGPFSHPVGTTIGWRFSAPTGTFLHAWSIWYSGYLRPWNSQNQGLLEVWGSASGRVDRIDGVGDFGVSSSARTGVHDSSMSVLIACDAPSGYPDCAAGQAHAALSIWSSRVVLEDDAPPTPGQPSGSAATSPTWQGTQVFAFPASDAGGGVHQAILEVDGVPVVARTIDEWGGRCVDAGGRVFRYPQPCPRAVDALVPVDANALPAGEHDVALRVADAAGNLATVYAARKTIVVPARRIGPGSPLAERGAENGENAADDARLTVRWTRSRRATLSSPYGRRNVIRGRLSTAGGVGIRGAKVELQTAVDGRTGAPLDKGGARTRGDGRFTLILPRNASSRTLLLRYRSHVNDNVAIAERTLRLHVRAGVTLGVAPRVAARGRTVRLAGKLVGRPLPAGGKVVELQARDPGSRWITFRTVRASRRGRFVTGYRFRNGGPAIYEMRARVRAAADYPYGTGVSHRVRVRVR